MTSQRTAKSVFLNSLAPLDASVEETLRHMNAEAALVVDAQGRLAGIVTDGDIRRAFLSGADLSTPVSEVMSRNPITIRDSLPRERIVSLMLERGIRHLPVIDSEGRPVGLELLKCQYSA